MRRGCIHQERAEASNNKINSQYNLKDMLNLKYSKGIRLILYCIRQAKGFVELAKGMQDEIPWWMLFTDDVPIHEIKGV